jgi:endonuclease G
MSGGVRLTPLAAVAATALLGATVTLNQVAHTETAPAAPPAPLDACLQRFAAIGLPKARGSQPSTPTLICRRGYALSYDYDTHDPDWVIERLTPAELTGKATRSNQFKPDPALTAPQVDNPDYTRSGFDRGHQAPAGDARFDQSVMDDSFYFSNMAPQVGIGFNRGAWAYLEETVRAWVLCGGRSEVFVITGPIYGAHAAPLVPGHMAIAVPTAFYKIVYDVASNHAVGFVLPNQKIGSTIDLQKYAKPITDIETDTGVAFFDNLTLRDQQQLKGDPGTVWGHIDSCKNTVE